ncbi:tripartite tricarboxylate transporter substrate binding protein [Allopusillimonas soli]|uniref:Tripartite tricarboxylate transporter substrate binding protein n=1 Tax=Allopusillimonas soli TaxID=659016 RepID=A0A853F4A0_9BURK|nr:tripartite tricarboxylate transporter substrate binding protein [Allopusillimonas soli]NYT35324.1 tripartite tricarboxylate transporter substrate binding protein [Allopusillimonas soli]TEA75746.1 tripartite tricarboxylate transporter substrate binding protein [Allopusillimonas soli]
MKKLLMCAALAVLATGASLPTLAASAVQDDYPSRPIQLIVPFSAGGQFDFLARLVAASMTKNLGKEIIVENVSGAGGNVGGAKAANAKPDGYTLLEYGGNFAIAKYLTKNLSYDPVGDFEPVAAISLAPHAVLVNNALPVKDFAELVQYAKANPDKINYASPGVGTSMQLTFEEIKAHFGFPATHIPYRGGSNALNDLASGQVGIGIVAVAPAMPFIESGQIRALAVTGPQRAQSLPDVPTIAELGYTGFSSGSWAGIVVPKGTPAPIVDRLHEAVEAALADPEVKERLASLSFTTLPGSQADFKARIQQEAERYGPIIEALNLHR